MADRYIDIFEVSEYGDFFLDAIVPLKGTSALVNIDAVSLRVRAAKERVETERTKAGITRKASGTEEVTIKATALRGHLTRFHNFLNSLDPEEHNIDPSKFFVGNVLKNLQQLKPDDVKARAEKISEAFSLEAYKDNEALIPWKKKLATAQQELAQALKAKNENRNESIILTASLSSAREEFLHVYNGVAKNLIRGLLYDLSREDEFQNYFKDLQVNEDKSSSTPKTEPQPPSE